MPDRSASRSRQQATKSGRWPACLALVTAAMAISGIGGQPVAAASTPVRCMRAQTPPAPRPGEVVMAGALKAHTDNVVEIPLGSRWTPTGFCASAEGAMQHPSSIEVGAGAALLLEGVVHYAEDPQVVLQLQSVWGAKNDRSGPDLGEGRIWDRTDEALAVQPEYLLKTYASCRDCALAHAHANLKGSATLAVAYARDLSGADLRGATLGGSFNGVNFNYADLTDANLSNAHLGNSSFVDTKTDRTDFDGANLGETRMDGLRFRSPPHFAHVTIDTCTRFKDTNLLGTGLTLQGVNYNNSYCSEHPHPMLPRTSAPLSFVAQAVRLGKNANRDVELDFDRATFVATAADRTDLAGADLSGQMFKRVKFIGFPASLVKTNFSRGQLQDADFDGAEVSGANFDNANLAGASFRGADLSDDGSGHGATFAGADTNLTRAHFFEADISGASFVGANLSRAVFAHALAEDTNFNGVRAPGAVFTDAHIYGDGQAFDSADNLHGADFNRAILAGNVDQNGGFNLTHADLTDANFDAAQCIGCNFTGSTLQNTHFIRTYLPGAILTGVTSMSGANLHDSWLYCRDIANTGCPPAGSTGQRWKWVLTLGTGEHYGPVPFGQTNLANAPLQEVATCPDGTRPTPPAGCNANLLPPSRYAPPIPPDFCSTAGLGTCPTRTSTLLDASSLGASRSRTGTDTPTALVAVSPANLITTDPGHGVYVAVSDATIWRLEAGEHRLVAGRPGDFCRTGQCGDGGPAKEALLGHVTGLAVGVDGSLYVADAGAHRVRRIETSGKITTVAGDGHPCVEELRGDCGDSGEATRAALAGPYGVWVDPAGRIYIADGGMGVRVVRDDGEIGSVGPEHPDVRGVVGDSSGDLYAATKDALLKFDPKDRTFSKVVGTGHPGYNGNRNKHGFLTGTDVQITEPSGLSVARNGDVLFADTQNALIRAYVPHSRHVVNVAGKVADERPQPGFNGDESYALETELSDPLAVVALPNEEFVAADAGNHRVRMFGPGP